MSQTEKEVKDMLASLRKFKVNPNQGLDSKLHEQYIHYILHELGELVVHFESAQPWLYYYAIHSAKLLGSDVSP